MINGNGFVAQRIKSATLTAALTLAFAANAQAALQPRDINGDTVADAYYDTVLNITWLANANAGAGSSFDNSGGVPGSNGPNDGWMTFANASAWAENLDVYGITGWRLPTVTPLNGISFQNNVSFNGSTDHGYNGKGLNTEMGYMFYVNLGYKGVCASTATLNCTFQSPSGVTSNMGPFSNIQSNAYWTNVESNQDPAKAMSFGFHNGYQWTNVNLKTDSLNAWAVHDGDIAAVTPVPEPEIYAMMLAGLGLMGFIGKRRKQKTDV